MTHREVIDNWCSDHRMSYATLARRCKLGGDPIGRICNGRKRLNARIALAIEKATGLSGLDLLKRQAKEDYELVKQTKLETA